MKRYLIGIDYGTLSGRCILVDSETGDQIAESVMHYAHGVMDERLPDGRSLPPLYALQHPQDYLDVLKVTVKEVLKKARVSPDSVAGMGIDFTACTLLPTDEDGTPLCFKENYTNEPHAYVKLWKHHASQPQADEILAMAKKRGETWLAAYGGKVSSEWMLPKILQVLQEAPQVYEDTARFMEAADWLSLVLTGKETHSAVFAAYKGLWNDETGYPSNAFMVALDPRLDGIVGTKISNAVFGMDQTAGTLNAFGAELTGLPEGTPVALPMIDGHAAIPATGGVGEGDVVMVAGTSGTYFINSAKKRSVKGICGYVKDGVVPGLYTYDAGQAALGDVFDWFVRNCVPASYVNEAEEKGISVHKLLRQKASARQVGESGLIALDWFNGNRSILVDSQLSGMILGLTLRTKPEEIYRALIEATAFGAKIILEQYEQYGLKIGRIYAAGGIAQKDEMMMQIYADVFGREICVAASAQAGALGSAIYAALAAGLYPNIAEATKRLVKEPIQIYRPNAQDHEAYSSLYAQYKTLHDYFGKGGNDVMRALKYKQ